MSPSSRRDAPRRASPRVSRGPRVDVRLGPRARASLASSARLARAARLLARAARTPRATARGGGDAFDRLVRAQPPELLASTHASARLEALDAFWRARGVRERAWAASASSRTPPRTTGARTSCTATPPGSPSRWIASRATFLARVDAAAMCWKAPGILRLPPKHVAAQLVSLRWALPDLDVPKIVEAQPGLLLRDVGACAAAALLRREFPLVDAVAVVETEPGVLAEECDVRARIERLREARANGRLSPSAEMFYDGEGLGCANPALFAKSLPRGIEEQGGGVRVRPEVRLKTRQDYGYICELGEGTRV